MRDALAILHNAQRISGDEPLANVGHIRGAALAALTNASSRPVSNPARPPIAGQPLSRRARTVHRRRDPRALGQSSRMLTPQRPESLFRGGHERFRNNRDARLTFGFTSFARGGMPRGHTGRMASALLMAAGSQPMPSMTNAQALEIVKGRALAMHTLGSLSYRFSRNGLDMQDGNADQTRLSRAQARFHMSPALLLAM